LRNASKLEGNFVARANGFARVMKHEGNFVAKANGFARVCDEGDESRGPAARVFDVYVY
jgi:hypothetical protein